VYLGILVLLASKASFSEGFIYLVLYNVMFVVPLILLMLLATNADVLLKMDEWRVVSRRRLKLLSGAFLIALAALMGYWLLIF
jgi:cytochrome c biogenesis protein CcdA